jgi:hypothetical protein
VRQLRRSLIDRTTGAAHRTHQVFTERKPSRRGKRAAKAGPRDRADYEAFWAKERESGLMTKDTPPTTQGVEIIEAMPTTEPVARSTAERMRAHRERRRKGLHCFTLEIRAREIDVLVHRGLLSPDARNDPYAVQMALYRHLDKTLRE